MSLVFLQENLLRGAGRGNRGLCRNLQSEITDVSGLCRNLQSLETFVWRRCRNLQGPIPFASRLCRNLQSLETSVGRRCSNLQRETAVVSEFCRNVQRLETNARPPCRNLQQPEMACPVWLRNRRPAGAPGSRAGTIPHVSGSVPHGRDRLGSPAASGPRSALRLLAPPGRRGW